jgi:hypothetical protein
VIGKWFSKHRSDLAFCLNTRPSYRDSGRLSVCAIGRVWGTTVNADSIDSMLLQSTRTAPILAACLLLATVVDCSKSLAEPTGSTRIDYGIPERLGREVGPVPSAPWRVPDLRGYTSLLRSSEPSTIDPQRTYNLVELIDIAQRLNPETRVPWESARQAAIAVGLVESEYFPVLTRSALGGYQSEAFPIPQDLVSSGFFRAELGPE